jgi:hypothetical protein
MITSVRVNPTVSMNEWFISAEYLNGDLMSFRLTTEQARKLGAELLTHCVSMTPSPAAPKPEWSRLETALRELACAVESIEMKRPELAPPYLRHYVDACFKTLNENRP